MSDGNSTGIKERCQCSECGGLRDPVVLRTRQRHAKRDQEIEQQALDEL